MDIGSLNAGELTHICFALTLLLGAAHLGGHLLERCGMPRVIGEIGGGILLGPTVLGALLPDAFDWLFRAFPAEGKVISGVSWIGLLLLMFISGFEVQRSLTQRDRRLVVALLVGAFGVAVIAGGSLASTLDVSRYLGSAANPLAFQLILALALAVTSIPVISKIFMDLGIMGSRFAKIVIAAATVEDVVLWVVLAVATALVQGTAVSVPDLAFHVVGALLFLGLGLLAMPALLRMWSRSRLNPWRQSSSTGYILLICLSFAAIASALSVNVIFGALVAGIAVGTLEDQEAAAAKKSIREFALGFLVPVYFAVVGLRLNLLRDFDGALFIAFLAFATAVKTIGTALSARIAGERWLACVNFGMAMNARGGPGIVLATIAFDLGIINEVLFVVLVLTALATSLLAGCWLKFILARRPESLDPELPNEHVATAAVAAHPAGTQP